jgi:hypothetical protein
MIKIIKHNLFFIFLMLMPISLLAQQPMFTEITDEAGIDFKYTFGDYSYENILESSGSGITVFDYNNDGFMDLYMLNGTYLEGISKPKGKIFKNASNKLYKNNGNGTFTEVSEIVGLNNTQWSMAAAIVDIDKDGFQDIYLLNYGPNVFYRNNGNGTFSDTTALLNLKGPDKLNGFTKWSIGASFWDYNLDGLQDVMVGNFLAFDPEYVSAQNPNMMPHPGEYKGQASLLYEQLPNGKFIEVTKKNDLFYPNSKCMGLTVFDFDNDDDMDIFQANDHQMNFLFRNDDGDYTEVGLASGVAVNSKGNVTGSMHGTVGDINGDGLIDIFVSDLKYGALYKNLGNGLFKDITESSGLALHLANKGSWGVSLFDFDNDGDLDIISANGTAEELILQYPLLLENDGKGHFKNVGRNRGSYFTKKRSGRGLAVWDFDNDGDLDVIISHVDLQANATLLRNDGGNKNHWLGLTLIGENGLTSAMGAQITVTTLNGKQVLLNQWATGYLSNSEPRLHIGLGNEAMIQSLEIKWPNGDDEVYDNIRADNYITIIKGKGIVTE